MDRLFSREISDCQTFRFPQLDMLINNLERDLVVCTVCRCPQFLVAGFYRPLPPPWPTRTISPRPTMLSLPSKSSALPPPRLWLRLSRRSRACTTPTTPQTRSGTRRMSFQSQHAGHRPPTQERNSNHDEDYCFPHHGGDVTGLVKGIDHNGAAIGQYLAAVAMFIIMGLDTIAIQDSIENLITVGSIRSEVLPGQKAVRMGLVPKRYQVSTQGSL